MNENEKIGLMNAAATVFAAVRNPKDMDSASSKNLSANDKELFVNILTFMVSTFKNNSDRKIAGVW
jgi:hypothetical protein